MSKLQEKTLSIAKERTHDITSWQEANINVLNSKAKKRYNKRKAAIVAYFTTDQPIDDITATYHLPSASILQLAERCLMCHEDGTPWGYRALLPSTKTIDHALQPSLQETRPEDVQINTDHEPAEEHTLLQVSREDTEEASDIEENLDETQKRSAILLSDQSFSQTQVSSPEAPVEDTVISSHEPEPIPDEPPVTLELLEATTKLPVIFHEPEPLPDEPPVALELPETMAELPLVPDEQEPISDESPVSPELPEMLIETSTHAHMSEQATIEEAEAIHDGEALVAPESTAIETSVPKGSAEQLHAIGRRITSSLYLVYKHRSREKQKHSKRFYRIVSLTIVAAILFGMLIPLGTGLAAYNVYTNISNMAHDGVNHLLAVKDLLPVSKSDPLAALDPVKLQQAHNEFIGAEDDFVQLQQLVNRSDIQSVVKQFSSDYGNKLTMAQHLIQVALDVSRMGQELSSVGIIGANIVHSSPLADGSSKPLISVSDIASIQAAIVHALYYLEDIRLNMSQVQLKDIPISSKQKDQLAGLLEQLPQAHDMIVQVQGLVSTVAWLLGVGSQRRFLVQTMDRGELRPSGGFTGQYGILQIQDGRVAPFNLRDVALLDYAGNGMELGRLAPPEYRNWMNFGNWGLRDSNLSGDYPTTAKMSMQVFEQEGGGPVDGDISFTPTFIGHLLDVTGPIRIDEYNETITSKNLEERLHYYQQNYTAIAIQREKTGDNSHAVRKAFTSLVGKLLLDRVRHLPTKQLLNVIKVATKDLQSRDLEIYLNDPTAEQWLVDHGYSGGTDSFTKQDGFMVVQANISISKASQYVHTTEHDDIVLDAQGGATHTLTITLDYQQTGPVYGYDTYADYIRVYLPPSAQYISGNGFDTGQALCKPTPPPPPSKNPGGTGGNKGGNGNPPSNPPDNTCAKYNTFFPNNARYCPNGNYTLGERGFHQPWSIDSLGEPTALTSDLPGRAMWGGLTETPKNCISYITLSWRVPNAVKHVAGQSSYTLLVQKQGGYIPSVEINVQTDAIKGLKPLNTKDNLVADKVYMLP